MKSNYSIMGEKGSENRWKEIHSKVKIRNKLTKEKVAIRAYLSGDGYIQFREKGFHYEINFYMDDLFVAERIANLFIKEYNICPVINHVKTTICGGTGYYAIRIKNKPACLDLLSFGKYGKLDWVFPRNLNKNLLKEWVKCYFDCEAHINKSRNQIQVKSVNGKQLIKINNFLKSLGINGKVYGPYSNGEGHNPYHMLSIYKLEDVLRYKKLIGFYHKKKQKALQSL